MSRAFRFKRNGAGFQAILRDMSRPLVRETAQRVYSSAASAGMPVYLEERDIPSRCRSRVVMVPTPGEWFEWRSHPDGSHYLKPKFRGNPLSKLC